MESLKLQTHVGENGVLQLQLPIINQDLEVMVIYQPIGKKSHSEVKKRFQKIRAQYGEKVFSNSVELLREDRQDG